MVTTMQRAACAAALAVWLLTACGGDNEQPPARAATSAEQAKAEVDELARMRAEVRRVGVVAALVGLEPVNIFARDPLELEAQRSRSRAKLAALLDALGAEVWRDAGLIDSTIVGMATAVVTGRGLEMLLMSDNVQYLRPGQSSSRMYASSGNLAAIDATLRAIGEAEVEVALNVDATDFTVDRAGRFAYRVSAEQQVQAKALLGRLLAGLTPEMVSNLEQVAAASFEAGPTLRMRVTRRGFVRLCESREVLSIWPVGWSDPRPLQTDAPSLVDRLAAGGRTLEVGLTMRDDPAMGPEVTREARDRHAASRSRIFDDILAPLGAGVVDRNDYGASLGTVSVLLTLPAYRQLIAPGDRRLQAVMLNRPIGSVSGS